MNKKLIRKILKNGPNRNSPEEMICAAWLIDEGYGKGKYLPNSTGSKLPPANLIWSGPTANGNTEFLQYKISMKILGIIGTIVIGLITSYLYQKLI